MKNKKIIILVLLFISFCFLLFCLFNFYKLYDSKIKVYEKQKHHCPYCVKEGNNREYAYREMHADHIQPWSKGGKTEENNCQMLCASHNESKGNKW